MGTAVRSARIWSTFSNVTSSPATISVLLLGSTSTTTSTFCLPGWAGPESVPRRASPVSIVASARTSARSIRYVRSCATGGTSTRSSVSASSISDSRRSAGASMIRLLLDGSALTVTSFCFCSQGIGLPRRSLGMGGSR